MKLKKLKFIISSIFFLYSSHVLASTGDTAEYPCGQMLGGTGIETVSKTGVLGAGTCTIKLSDDVLNSISKIESVQKQLNELKDQNANQLSASQEGAVMYDDPNLKNTVTLNPGGAGTTITNVKNGNIASNSKDAVNGSQLWQTQTDFQNALNQLEDNVNKSKTTVSAGKNIVVNKTTNADGSTDYSVSSASNVNFDKVVVGSVTIDKTKTDKKGNTIISGVGDGSLASSSKEAINGGQLNNVASSISDHLGGGSKFDPSTGVITAPKYTIQGNDYNNVSDAMIAVDDKLTNVNDKLNNVNRNIKHLDKRIDETRKYAAKGIASALALNIKYPSQHPGEFAGGMGWGTYDGEVSMALGLNYLTPNGKINFSGGVGYGLNGGSNKPAGNLSLGFVF